MEVEYDEERITEYTIIFKEDTELYKQYNGEFISENKWETDEIFENYKEQVERYFSKDWVRIITLATEEDDFDDYGDWEEDWVEVFYESEN